MDASLVGVQSHFILFCTCPGFVVLLLFLVCFCGVDAPVVVHDCVVVCACMAFCPPVME